ncbi:MAG: hypothetical protein RL684_2111 [Pseudomonadota bacterium]|jgi:uncharacterized membrane protein YfcA
MSIDLVLIVAASFLAGLVDAIVGGGGLVLLPAMFASFPAAAPATLLGTNKFAAVWGTLFAARRFARRVSLRWALLLPAAATALAGSFAGAWSVTQVDPGWLRRALPFVLLVVFLYTLANEHLGRAHAPRLFGRAEVVAACLIGLAIGWYDGFFGPGTGSFFIFLFVRVLGFDFLHASASAKVMNVATNIAALVLFGAKGYIWWQVGLLLAFANVAGSMAGTALALRHGAGFVRWVFIAVVGALILKTGYDAL